MGKSRKIQTKSFSVFVNRFFAQGQTVFSSDRKRKVKHVMTTRIDQGMHGGTFMFVANFVIVGNAVGTEKMSNGDVEG